MSTNLAKLGQIDIRCVRVLDSRKLYFIGFNKAFVHALTAFAFQRCLSTYCFLLESLLFSQVSMQLFLRLVSLTYISTTLITQWAFLCDCLWSRQPQLYFPDEPTWMHAGSEILDTTGHMHVLQPPMYFWYLQWLWQLRLLHDQLGIPFANTWLYRKSNIYHMYIYIYIYTERERDLLL